MSPLSETRITLTAESPIIPPADVISITEITIGITPAPCHAAVVTTIAIIAADVTTTATTIADTTAIADMTAVAEFV